MRCSFVTTLQDDFSGKPTQFYAPQTKILEMRIFEALFKGESTRFGLRIFEKYLETHHLTVASVLLPKSLFEDHKVVWSLLGSPNPAWVSRASVVSMRRVHCDLPNPAWLFLGNVVPHNARCPPQLRVKRKDGNK